MGARWRDVAEGRYFGLIGGVGRPCGAVRRFLVPVVVRRPCGAVRRLVLVGGKGWPCGVIRRYFGLASGARHRCDAVRRFLVLAGGARRRCGAVRRFLVLAGGVGGHVALYDVTWCWWVVRGSEVALYDVSRCRRVVRCGHVALYGVSWCRRESSIAALTTNNRRGSCQGGWYHGPMRLSLRIRYSRGLTGMPAATNSSRSRFALVWLHRLQAQTQLSGVVCPPLERGSRWSIVSP